MHAGIARLLLLVLLVLPACRRTDVPAPAACEAVAPPLSASAAVGNLAGHFRIALVATAGPRAGASVAGTLTLQPVTAAPSPAGVRYPLAGSASLALDAVGATAPGAIGSVDPHAPGVRVVEWMQGAPPARLVALRLGADANRGDRLLFDGAFLALHVHGIAADSFGGTWTSGSGADQASGHFCAVRS